VAERRARAVAKRLHSHEIETLKAVNLRLIVLAVVAATLALIGAIWFAV
jgi:hypothetical protein